MSGYVQFEAEVDGDASDDEDAMDEDDGGPDTVPSSPERSHNATEGDDDDDDKLGGSSAQFIPIGGEGGAVGAAFGGVVDNPMVCRVASFPVPSSVPSVPSVLSARVHPCPLYSCFTLLPPRHSPTEWPGERRFC
jgi:hypothetical protein